MTTDNTVLRELADKLTHQSVELTELKAYISVLEQSVYNLPIPQWQFGQRKYRKAVLGLREFIRVSCGWQGRKIPHNKKD